MSTEYRVQSIFSTSKGHPTTVVSGLWVRVSYMGDKSYVAPGLSLALSGWVWLASGSLPLYSTESSNCPIKVCLLTILI